MSASTLGGGDPVPRSHEREWLVKRASSDPFAIGQQTNLSNKIASFSETPAGSRRYSLQSPKLQSLASATNRHKENEHQTREDREFALKSPGSSGDWQRLTVFEAAGCHFCKQLVARLDEANIPHQTVSLSIQPWRREEMYTRSEGLRTVPMLFFDNTVIGGNDTLEAILVQNSITVQQWFASMLTKLPRNTVDRIAPSPDTESAKNILKHSAALIEEIAWKADELRQRVGLEKIVATWPKLLRIIRDLKWAFSDDGAEKQAHRLERAEVFRIVYDEPKKIKILGREDADVATRFCVFDKVGCLNELFKFEKLAISARDAIVVVAALKGAVSLLYDKLLYANGHGIAFEKTRQHVIEWKSVLGLLAELQCAKGMDKLSDSGRMSLFINSYNLLHVLGCILYGSPSSSTSRLSFFTDITINLCGRVLNLDQIEHGCLRGVVFGTEDPRQELVPQPFDPRIHFTLHCGAQSCPAILVYGEETLDTDLAWATAVFCAENVAIDMDLREVTVSRLHHWYFDDFVHPNKQWRGNVPAEKQLLQWIADHGDFSDSRAGQLQTILKEYDARRPKLRWARYEWARARAPGDVGARGANVVGRTLQMTKSDLYFWARRRKERKIIAHCRPCR